MATALGDPAITVFLADDNLLVREGVRALLALEPDLRVVGTAADYHELIRGAEDTAPQVIVTDIRMPPAFQREGIDAAKQVRKRHPGTGVVVLSQYDDPDYAIALLREGADGYAYLLKDRVDQGEQLARAVRAVAAGGSMLDPAIAEALITPVSHGGDLTAEEEQLLQLMAEGRPIKAIAASRRTTPAAVSAAIEDLFLKLACEATARTDVALRRLRLLHQAIVEREERQESLSRLLPAAVVEKLRGEGRRIGDSERLVVTVLLSDIRGYSTIAEGADPTRLATQLSEHRAEVCKPIMAADAARPCRAGAGHRPGRPRHPGRAQPALAGRRTSRIPARHRAVHRRGGRRPARLRGAAGVHGGRRHGEPRPAAAAVGRPRPDRAERGHLGRAGRGRRGRPAPPGAGQGPQRGGGGLPHHERTRSRRMTMDQPERPDAVIRVRGVRKTYESEGMPVRALRGVDFEMAPREFVAVMGPSGCGKSTLLNLVAGLDTPSEGDIAVAGEPLAGKDENELARMRRRHVGIVFQFFNLLEGMTCLENVALPAMIAGASRKQAERRARDLLDLLGLGDKARSVPAVLSGGQRQRLAIARALANQPTMLLADEPTGALDSDGGAEVMELFRRLHTGGQTILLVTHDQEVAAAASRIAWMRDGRMADGETDATTPTLVGQPRP